MEQNAFSKRLQRLLNETNTTRQQLAKAIGVSHQSVTQWQSGQTIPDIYKYKKIAEFFGVSYEYLYGDTECKSNENKLECDELNLSEKAVIHLKNNTGYRIVSDFLECNTKEFFLRIHNYYVLKYCRCEHGVSDHGLKGYDLFQENHELFLAFKEFEKIMLEMKENEIEKKRRGY